MSDGPDPMLGRVLAETYRLERLLGEGGMGVVYEASHSRLGRSFAVKMLYPEVAANTEAVSRFEREARVTSELGHRSIVEIIDFNRTTQGEPYIVMELLSGEDLEHRLARDGRLSLEICTQVVRQVASALSSAHEHGVIHRDLKPSNVFICDDDLPGEGSRVKVLDFGISKVVGAASAITRTRFTMGTPGYMSPEQAEGRSREVDQRTDVFSLGAILYEMLGGHPPFEGESIPTVLYKIVHEDPRPLRQLDPGLPPALEALVGRALAKSKERRFDSMGELLGAWDAALGRPGSRSEALQPTVMAPAEAARLTKQEGSAMATFLDRLGQLWAVGRRQAVALVRQIRARLETLEPRRRRAVILVAAGLAALLLGSLFGLAARGCGGAEYETIVAHADHRPGPDALPLPSSSTDSRVPRPDRVRLLDAGPRPVHMVLISATDRAVSCNVEMESGDTVAAPVPCRFQVPDAAQITLHLARDGYSTLTHRWRVVRDHRMVVHVAGGRLELTEQFGH